MKVYSTIERFTPIEQLLNTKLIFQIKNAGAKKNS